jgi:membrane protein YdbS with pleckstrin-like domain
MRAPFESGLPQSVPRRERIARDTARAMHEVAWRSPSPRLLTMRRTEVAAVALPLAALAFALLLAAGELAVGAIAAAAVHAAGALAFVFVTRRVRAWGYAERDDDLLVRRGVAFARLSVVPYGRMQFIDVTAGPVERTFGLATVRMHTAAAASDARIPGLPAAEAERLRDRLAELGEAQASGL